MIPLINQKNRSLAALLFTVFLDMVGISVVIPILAPLFLIPSSGLLDASVGFSARAATLGFLLAAYPLAQFFGAPMLGALSDRHGRKKLLQFSLLGTVLGWMVFAFGLGAHSIPLLFIGRIIDGLTGGNTSVALSAIADLSEEKEKARNFGLIGMVFGFGFIIGPFIGGKLADPSVVSWFDFTTPIWFAALLSAFNVLALTYLFKETSTTRVRTPLDALAGFRNIRKAFRMANLRTMFVVVFLLAFGFNFFTTFFPVFLAEKFAFNQSRIGEMFGYIGFWIAFGQGVVTRAVSRRLEPKTVLLFSTALLGLTLPFLLLAPQASFLFLVLPFVAMFQALTYPNSTAIISNLSGKESQGEILGINQSVQSLAMAIPPIIAGFIVSININLPILVASACTLLAWTVFALFYRRSAKAELFHEV